MEVKANILFARVIPKQHYAPSHAHQFKCMQTIALSLFQTLFYSATTMMLYAYDDNTTQRVFTAQ